MEGQEQNKTEEASPFKLRKAREKGQVARGMDLGFVGSLIALAIFIVAVGHHFVGTLAQLMQVSIVTGIDRADNPSQILSTIGSVYWMAFQPLFLLGCTIAVILIFLELLQLRGFIFSAQPLKPDFNRLNPAKGLKRVFSLKMLKETGKNIVKMAVYSAAAWLLIIGAIDTFGDSVYDARHIMIAIEASAKQLLFWFIGIAFFFMVIDQLIVRKEFSKQMRMSRRELTRETREHDGEPRFKQKRKELHMAMLKQSEGLGKIEGSDFLVTNPEHYAVALSYQPDKMDAPVIRAKGRNHFAQLMKRKARLLNVPVLVNPPLARALFRDCQADQPVPHQHYHEVAKIYLRLRALDESKA